MVQGRHAQGEADMRHLLAATALAACLHGPAAAQGRKVPIPGDALQEQDPAGTALVEAFGLFCLKGFPGAARMEDAAPGRLTPMTPAQVESYLHGDPGRGWTYAADGGTYVLTVEDPPYHTCAVRRSYATPPRYRLPWLLTTQLWAAAAGRGPFQDAKPEVMRQNGLLIEAVARLLPGEGGDVFMELKTTYPDGHFEQRLARRAIGR